MDIVQSIIHINKNAKFELTGNNYNDIIWKSDNSQSKPTLAECEAAWQEIINKAPMKRLREERDKKLLETDKYSINDWPHASEEVKQAWVTYRQELRDLPATSTPQIDDNDELTNVIWPTPPS